MGIAAAISVGSTFRRRNKERKGTTPPERGPSIFARKRNLAGQAADLVIGSVCRLAFHFYYLLSYVRGLL